MDYKDSNQTVKIVELSLNIKHRLNKYNKRLASPRRMYFEQKYRNTIYFIRFYFQTWSKFILIDLVSYRMYLSSRVYDFFFHSNSMSF